MIVTLKRDPKNKRSNWQLYYKSKLVAPNICDDGFRDWFTTDRRTCEIKFSISSGSIDPAEEWQAKLLADHILRIDDDLAFPCWPALHFFLRMHFGCDPFFISVWTPKT